MGAFLRAYLKLIGSFCQKHKRIKVFVFLVSLLLVFGSYYFFQQQQLSLIKIGYFHGGRVNIVYRAHIYNSFDQENIKVKLYTQDLRSEKLIEIPKSNDEFQAIRGRYQNLGKMSGIEIVDRIVKGEVQAGTIGESSFIQKITEGAPIVAVALLGADQTPGKGIVLQQGTVIDSPEDFKGLTLASRRAGPGDYIFLMEFLEDEGLNKNDLNIIGEVDESNVTKLVEIGKLSNKVNVITQVDDDYIRDWFEKGIIDGGLYHMSSARELIVGRGVGYLYRPMDWMNSEISHAVLVFHKEYIEYHPEEVQKVVNAVIKRIYFERNLPDEEINRGWDKGLFMDSIFRGLSSPKYDYPPIVQRDLLYAIQELMIKYGYINREIDIEPFIDDSFVKKIYKELEQEQ